MAGSKHTDIDTLRDAATKATRTRDSIDSAKAAVDDLNTTFANPDIGEIWGSSKEARGIAEALQTMLGNRLDELGSIRGALAEIGSGLSDVADAEEKTEGVNKRSFE